MGPDSFGGRRPEPQHRRQAGGGHLGNRAARPGDPFRDFNMDGLACAGCGGFFGVGGPAHSSLAELDRCLLRVLGYPWAEPPPGQDIATGRKT